MPDPLRRAVPSTEAQGAQWWLARRHSVAAHDVASLLADGFEAYARILHPATRRDADTAREVEVRWAEVAAWSGRRLHPLAQFASLHRASALHGASALNVAPAAPQAWPFDNEPECGPLPGAQARALVEVLSAHAGEADQACWFGVWDGYAWLYPRASGSYAPLTLARPWTQARRARWRARNLGLPVPWTDHRILPPLLTAGSRRKPLHPAGARRDAVVHAEIRDYLLCRGPLRAALTSPEGLEPGAHWREQDGARWADLWWPDDCSWLIAGNTDLDSTYLGGSVALIEAVLAAADLEALPVGPEDQITADSDALNRH